MKPIMTRLTATALFALLSIPLNIYANGPDKHRQTRYAIVDLGPVGGPPGAPYDITNNGVVAGAAVSQENTQHAVLWYQGHQIDVGSPGLGGLNSAAFGVNERGETVGEAQTSDPDDEDFCGFTAYGLPASNTACLPFFWRYGAMQPLPTLGGPNGTANRINNRGQVVGFAETGVQESNCPVFQFKPVVWQNGSARQLPTFSGDTDGAAAWINDNGQVVGSSGACAPFNPNSQLYLVENHALLWENNTVTDLGNLGGTGGIAGNHACAINNRGQIVGHSELPNDTTFHGFLWTREAHMQDLGTLEGDYASLALAIDDKGTVVGASLDNAFNPRAVVWEQGELADLNTLLAQNPGLYLLFANAINDRGEIVGFGVTSTGELHGFLAQPSRRNPDAEDATTETDETAAQLPRPALSADARRLLHQQIGHRYHIGGLQ